MGLIEFAIGPVVGGFGGCGLALEEGENVLHFLVEAGDDTGIWVCFVKLASEQIFVGDGFETAGAGEAPAGLSGQCGEERFVPGLGGEFSLTGGEKLIELGLIFVSEDAEGVDGISHCDLSLAAGWWETPLSERWRWVVSGLRGLGLHG